MPGLTFSSCATEADVELYTTGCCHVLALAMHREFGWPMVIVSDNHEVYWQDPNDEDAQIPSVAHVYALAPDGKAWDVFGSRDLDDVRDEVEERWHVQSYGLTILGDESELLEFVGEWGEDSEGDVIDRPLPEYSDLDIAEAVEDIRRLFPQLLEATVQPS
jgi:hypothetical protein